MTHLRSSVRHLYSVETADRYIWHLDGSTFVPRHISWVADDIGVFITAYADYENSDYRNRTLHLGDTLPAWVPIPDPEQMASLSAACGFDVAARLATPVAT